MSDPTSVPPSNGNGRKFELMFDAKWFVNMSRLMMISATLIGLPVAGWGMKRLVDKADTIVDTVAKTDKRIDLLEQLVRFQGKENREVNKQQKEMITDHEGRIRFLERITPTTPARP